MRRSRHAPVKPTSIMKWSDPMRSAKPKASDAAHSECHADHQKRLEPKVTVRMATGLKPGLQHRRAVGLSFWAPRLAAGFANFPHVNGLTSQLVGLSTLLVTPGPPLRPTQRLPVRAR